MTHSLGRWQLWDDFTWLSFIVSAVGRSAGDQEWKHFQGKDSLWPGNHLPNGYHLG